MPVLNASLGIGAQAAANLLTLGPIIPVQVWVPSALELYLKSKGINVPPPATGNALVDTDATLSAVGESVIRSSV
jgi:hypothetical protein